MFLSELAKPSASLGSSTDTLIIVGSAGSFSPVSGKVQSEKQSYQERGLLEDLTFCHCGSSLCSLVSLSALHLEPGPKGSRVGSWEGKMGRKWRKQGQTGSRRMSGTRELGLVPALASVLSKASTPRNCSRSRSLSSLGYVCTWLRTQGSWGKIWMIWGSCGPDRSPNSKKLSQQTPPCLSCSSIWYPNPHSKHKTRAWFLVRVVLAASALCRQWEWMNAFTCLLIPPGHSFFTEYSIDMGFLILQSGEFTPDSA